MSPLIDTLSFSRRYYRLILLAWTVPAIFGLSFLVYIRMFSIDQMLAILTTPLEPLFVIIWVGFALWYFQGFAKPIRAMLEMASPGPAEFDAALLRMRRFPFNFWSLFLVYLIMAPSSVILAATLHTDFSASHEDWFRIHLVALIVSIIVGLPIFFRILDLFGQVVTDVPLTRPHVTLKAKVFLIGALMPLLVDTMIVQYYWTKTGYFGFDTFIVWATLEVLAIGGSLVFVASINQSLSPLQSLVSHPDAYSRFNGYRLAPHSTDELGVLASRYRQLLDEISSRNQLLHVSTQVFREKGGQTRMDDLAPRLLDLCQTALGGEMIVMMLADELREELVAVAQTGKPYASKGHFRLSLHQTSVASQIYESEVSVAVENASHSWLIPQQLRMQFEISSVVGAPLDAEGKVIGVLLAFSSTHRAYTKDDIALFESLTREVAFAVNAQLLYVRQAASAEELRRVNEYNQLLLESTGEGIFGVDAELRCTFINRAASHILNYAPQEVLGKRMDQFLCRSDEQGTMMDEGKCHMSRTIMEGVGFRVDNNFLRTKTGELIPVQFSSNPIKVGDRTTGAVVVFRDVAKARAMARRMDYLASHDTLTGLLNRHRFEQHLELALDSTRSEAATHILCYLDLDQFKVVNDTCGHVAGDELLRQVTAELQKHIRQGDILARLGGDEFGILLQQCPVDQALRLAHGLRKTVEEFRFVWQDRTFALGVSIGIAVLDRNTRSINEALSNADTACYVAKDAGRNRVHLHQPDDLEVNQRYGEMQWVSRIQDALDQNRFRLVFQPIVPCVQQGPVGMHMEVMIRLQNGTETDILPGAFLPAAERFNLSTAVDRWVIEQVFRWIAGLGERLGELNLCCINLSATSIVEDEFPRFVIERMHAHGVPGGKLCFEVTETAAIANLSRAVQFMTTMKGQGCHFALDDFGSGMSSFGYLKTLPVDFLKIDGSFVRDMANDHIDHTMVKSINEVGHAMGIYTIAEFVEDDITRIMLKDIGVDYAQGYAIGQPQPLAYA